MSREAKDRWRKSRYAKEYANFEKYYAEREKKRGA